MPRTPVSVAQAKTQLPKPEHDDLLYAYECAADFLEAEEWPEADGGRQVAAYREVAKRLRATAARMDARKTGLK